MLKGPGLKSSGLYTCVFQDRPDRGAKKSANFCIPTAPEWLQFLCYCDLLSPYSLRSQGDDRMLITLLINWVGFVAIARWLSWWLRKLDLDRDGILHPTQGCFSIRPIDSWICFDSGPGCSNWFYSRVVLCQDIGGQLHLPAAGATTDLDVTFTEGTQKNIWSRFGPFLCQKQKANNSQIKLSIPWLCSIS